MIQPTRMKTRTRLALSHGLITLLLIVCGLMALVKMSTMRTQEVEITDNWLPSVDVVHRINTATSDMRIAEFAHVLNTDDKAIEALDREIVRLRGEIESMLARYEKLISSDEERALYGQFQSEWKKYLTLQERLLALSRVNDNVKAKELMEGPAKQAFDAYSAHLVKLVELNTAGAKASAEAAASAYAEAKITLATLTALGLLLAVAASVVVTRGIVRALGAEPARSARRCSAWPAGTCHAPSPCSPQTPPA